MRRIGQTKAGAITLERVRHDDNIARLQAAGNHLWLQIEFGMPRTGNGLIDGLFQCHIDIGRNGRFKVDTDRVQQRAVAKVANGTVLHVRQRIQGRETDRRGQGRLIAHVVQICSGNGTIHLRGLRPQQLLWGAGEPWPACARQQNHAARIRVAQRIGHRNRTGCRRTGLGHRDGAGGGIQRRAFDRLFAALVQRHLGLRRIGARDHDRHTNLFGRDHAAIQRRVQAVGQIRGIRAVITQQGRGDRHAHRATCCDQIIGRDHALPGGQIARRRHIGVLTGPGRIRWVHEPARCGDGPLVAGNAIKRVKQEQLSARLQVGACHRQRAGQQHFGFVIQRGAGF